MAKTHKPGTLGAAVGEMRRGEFLVNAQVRASRRKSPWNLLLLLIFPLWIWLWLQTLALVWHLALLMSKGFVPSSPLGWLRGTGLQPGPITGAGALYAFGPFFPVLILAAVLGNFLIYLIPPARKAMDAEDKAFPGTEYATAQRTLGRLALVTMPIGLAYRS